MQPTFTSCSSTQVLVSRPGPTCVTTRINMIYMYGKYFVKSYLFTQDIPTPFPTFDKQLLNCWTLSTSRYHIPFTEGIFVAISMYS